MSRNGEGSLSPLAFPAPTSVRNTGTRMLGYMAKTSEQDDFDY
jgi:hypothetical protein